jgi:putative membrane protein
MNRTTLVFAASFLFTPAVITAQQNAGPDDPTIVAIVDAANTADIETGQLAVDRASAEPVRAFGQMMVTEHSYVRKLGRDLAVKLGVTPTPPADAAAARAHAATMTRLGALSGAAFDRAYLEHEVAFHTAVINAVTNTLLPAIDNAELKALVEKAAPTFVAHKQLAERLLKNL